MSRLDHHISGVRNKLAVQRGVVGLAWAALAVCGLVLLGVLIVRLAGLTMPPIKIALACAAGVVVLAAIVWGMVRRPNARDAAVYIDQKLHLEERFSTALHVRSLNDPFAKAALIDAETMADKVSGGVPVTVQFPTVGYVSVVLAALAVTAFFFMPQMDAFGHRASAQKKAAQRAAVAEAHDSAKAALVEIESLPKSQSEAPEFKQLQQDLRLIVQQKQVADPAAANREALQAIQDVKQKLDETASIERMQTVSENRFFAQIEPGANDNTPVGQAEREMAKGQMNQAMNDLSNVVKNFSQMDQAQQTQVQEQVKDLANKLQQAASNPQTQQEIQKKLQQLGANQQQAQQLAQQMQQAAQGNMQAQQQLQQAARQMMSQMNNGQGPTQQQQQQLQQMMGQMQAAANSQQQAQSMAAAAQQLASAMQQAQQKQNQNASQGAQANAQKPGQNQTGQGQNGPGQKPGQQAGSQAAQAQGARAGPKVANNAAGQKPGQSPSQQANAGQGSQPGQKPSQGQQGQANKGGNSQSQTANQGQNSGQGQQGQKPGQGQSAQASAGGQKQGQPGQGAQPSGQSGSNPTGGGSQQMPGGGSQQMASAQGAMQQAMANMQAAQQNANQVTAAQAQANAAQQQALNGMNAPGAGQNPGQQQNPGGNQGQGQWGVQQPGQNGQQNGQPGGQGGPGFGTGGNTGVAVAPYGIKQQVDLSKEDANGKMLASSLIKDNHPDPGKAKLMLSAITASQSQAAADQVDAEHISGAARQAAEDYFRRVQKDAQQQPPPK